MRNRTRRLSAAFAALGCLPLLTGVAHSERSAELSNPSTPVLGAAAAAPTPPHENVIVSVGHDSTLAAGERADVVVSVLGASVSAGEVSDVVVSVLGNTRVTGPVGNAAVAVMGSIYVNSKVKGDVAAVLGNVELGPNADVGGQVTAVAGTVTRDPDAAVRGGVRSVGLPWVPSLTWLRPWIENCLFYGRPLAFTPGLGWAWTIALGSLALYVLGALLFPIGVDRCVRTFEEYPGQSILAALLTIVATPVAMVLLIITIIGMLAIPFLGIALLAAESFGKLAMLAWIGRRVTKPATAGATSHVAFAVFIGGLIVTALYVVPVLGFILYKVLGFLGLGVVVYALLLAVQARRETHPPRSSGPTGAAFAAAAASTATAAPLGSEATAEAAQAQAARPEAPAQSAQQTGAADAGTAAPPSPKTVPAATAVAYARAGFWIRMGALLIDAILIGVILRFIVGPERIHLLLLASYGAVMWKLKGTTVGGVVFNLQVVRLDGRELDWATAIVRALSCFLSLFLLGLGFIWIAFDEQRQAWHDKIAGTVVVRVPKGVSLL
ncbi:MAG: RDD family protein [Gammaproteobacteria bacterium]|nr:MAG: RDD family protein [Gammaproteobacteria bacterium]